MTNINVIISVVFFAVTFAVILGCIAYAVTSRRNNNSYTKDNSLNGKQDYIKRNNDKYGVNNQGSTMNNKHIYCIPYSKMGYKDGE